MMLAHSMLEKHSFASDQEQYLNIAYIIGQILHMGSLSTIRKSENFITEGSNKSFCTMLASVWKILTHKTVSQYAYKLNTDFNPRPYDDIKKL